MSAGTYFYKEVVTEISSSALNWCSIKSSALESPMKPIKQWKMETDGVYKYLK